LLRTGFRLNENLRAASLCFVNFPESGSDPARSGAGRPEENTWAMACHLAALAGYVGIPFGNIVGPLIVWLIRRDTSALVDDQGKEALNAQISLTCYLVAAGLLCFVLIGFVIFPIIYLVALVLVIVAGVKANDGLRYRYPFIFRLIK
jgi:uncharacterized Tic20 family protein